VILNRNEDFPHATSSIQIKFGFQTLDISNRKRNISIAKDLYCHGSNSLKLLRITSSIDMTNRNIGQVVNLLESSPSKCVGQVISSHLILIIKLFIWHL